MERNLEGLSSIPTPAPGPSPLGHFYGCPKCGARQEREFPLCRECALALVAQEQADKRSRKEAIREARSNSYCKWNWRGVGNAVD